MGVDELADKFAQQHFYCFGRYGREHKFHEPPAKFFRIHNFPEPLETEIISLIGDSSQQQRMHQIPPLNPASRGGERLTYLLACSGRSPAGTSTTANKSELPQKFQIPNPKLPNPSTIDLVSKKSKNITGVIFMDLVVLQNWLDNISFAILFSTMLIYWVGAAFPGIPYLWALGTAGMAVANLSIAALLGSRWIEAGYFPLSNLYESLFFLVWGITAIHLVAENMSRSRLVGVATSPVAMAISAFAALTLPATMQSAEPLVPALKSNWLMMHVSVMMLSYSTLMVGALLAIAFLIVTRGQKIELTGSSFGTNSNRNGNYRLQRPQNPEPQIAETSADSALAFSEPSFNSNNNGLGTTAVLELATVQTPSTAATQTAELLSPQRLNLAETLDNISYRIIGLGFPLLTVGIIAGAVWANEAWGSYWSWDPKETWALITWLVFAAYLHARITRGWQGRRPAILAATGFVVVWICYLGVNLLGKGLHSYGWFF